MSSHDVTLIALDLRKWDLETQRLSFLTYFVMDDEEKTLMFDVSIVQPPDMVEEFIGKVVNGCRRMMERASEAEEEVSIVLGSESFVRQKLYNYFKRILLELNNPKRKKGQSKMIFTTHMDVYNENQDVSFLPLVIQFFVILNWARKYYEKEDYQRAIDPLRKLVKVKPDFGLAYKWLARSLKKIRKYDEAMRFYEKYAEVDDTLDAKLDLAKSLRKGKIFDRAEAIYKAVLAENPGDREARIGMAQIQYAQNDPSYLDTLNELYQEDPEWLQKWLQEEFNFRIYIPTKTTLVPVQAAKYLGFEQVFELTQKAFKNEVPSHFNPGKARMRFYKEELDNWAMISNRFHSKAEEIQLHPENVEFGPAQLVEEDEDMQNEESAQETSAPAKPAKYSTKVEEILKKLRAGREAGRARREAAEAEAPVNKKAARKEKIEPEKPKPAKLKEPKAKETKKAATSRRDDASKTRQTEVAAKSEKTVKRRGRPPRSAKQSDEVRGEESESDYSGGIGKSHKSITDDNGKTKNKKLKKTGQLVFELDEDDNS